MQSCMVFKNITNKTENDNAHLTLMSVNHDQWHILSHLTAKPEDNATSIPNWDFLFFASNWANIHILQLRKEKNTSKLKQSLIIVFKNCKFEIV